MYNNMEGRDTLSAVLFVMLGLASLIGACWFCCRKGRNGENNRHLSVEEESVYLLESCVLSIPSPQITPPATKSNVQTGSDKVWVPASVTEPLAETGRPVPSLDFRKVGRFVEPLSQKIRDANNTQGEEGSSSDSDDGEDPPKTTVHRNN